MLNTIKGDNYVINVIRNSFRELLMFRIGKALSSMADIISKYSKGSPEKRVLPAYVNI